MWLSFLTTLARLSDSDELVQREADANATRNDETPVGARTHDTVSTKELDKIGNYVQAQGLQDLFDKSWPWWKQNCNKCCSPASSGRLRVRLRFREEAKVHRAAVRAKQQALADQSILMEPGDHHYKRFVFRKPRPEEYDLLIQQVKSAAAPGRVLEAMPSRHGDSLVISVRAPRAQLLNVTEMHFRVERKPSARSAIALRESDPFVSSADLYRERQVLRETVRANPVTIIDSETGSGKTSLVPLLLAAEEGQGELRRVLCTQVRRIATESAALRAVDLTHSAELGRDIGYQIGGKSLVGRGTSIVYCIDAIAMMTALQDGCTLGYTHVIVDEVHTRTHYTDLLLAALKHFHLCKSPHLRIVIMSASADTGRMAAYFQTTTGKPAAIFRSSSGQRFPIEERYLDDIRNGTKADGDPGRQLYSASVHNVGAKLPPFWYFLEWVDRLLAKKVIKKNSRVLVFLPGRREIDECAHFLRFLNGTHVATLFGGVPVEQQHEIIRDLPTNAPAFILATDVVETSVTIADCDHVIDFCRHKRLREQPGSVQPQLTLELIAQAEAKQRKGRTGRTTPGTVHRLVTKAQWERLLEFPEPEIQSMRVADVLLMLQDLLPNSLDPRTFLTDSQYLLSPINKKGVDQGYQALEEAGAFLLSKTGSRRGVSSLGRLMTELYTDIEYVQLVVNGLHFGLVADAVLLAAVLRHGSPFLEDSIIEAPAERVRLIHLKRACCAFSSDVLHRWGAVKAWRQYNLERWRWRNERSRFEQTNSRSLPSKTQVEAPSATTGPPNLPSRKHTTQEQHNSASLFAAARNNPGSRTATGVGDQMPSKPALEFQIPKTHTTSYRECPLPSFTDADLAEELAWCRLHSIDNSKMREIEDTARQFYDALIKVGFISEADFEEMFGKPNVRAALQKRSAKGQRVLQRTGQQLTQQHQDMLRFVRRQGRTAAETIPIDDPYTAIFIGHPLAKIARTGCSENSIFQSSFSLLRKRACIEERTRLGSTSGREDATWKRVQSLQNHEKLLLWLLASSYLPNLLGSQGSRNNREVTFELRKQARRGEYQQRHAEEQLVHVLRAANLSVAENLGEGTVRFVDSETTHTARQFRDTKVFTRVEVDTSVKSKRQCYPGEVILGHDTCCELSGEQLLIAAVMIPVAGGRFLARELSALPHADMANALVAAMHPAFGDASSAFVSFKGVSETIMCDVTLFTPAAKLRKSLQGHANLAERNLSAATVTERRALVLEIWQECEARQKRAQLKPQTVTRCITVPAGKKGFVIGKGGANLRSIQDLSGARVKMPPKGDPSENVMVSGTSTQVDEAIRLIENKL
ncbi:unnamed protein product [Amoebophrya sp. A120]|nr:unnamed protein product [Amoebophrya sp. A120]|eukprot:GSA120T00005587001.1